MGYTGFTEFHLFDMVLFQFMLFCGLIQSSFATGSSGIRLYNSYMKKCLTHDVATSAVRSVGQDCDLADPYQEWRWIDNYFLQNVGSGLCMTSISTVPYFEMQACDGSNDQRLICSFNQIFGSVRGQHTKNVGMTTAFRIAGNTVRVKTRWEVHGTVNEMSICNRTSFREHRKWRRLASSGMDVGSGLNTWITVLHSTTSINNILIMDSPGNTRSIFGTLSSVSLAPHALWGLQWGDAMWYTKQQDISSGEHNVVWLTFGAGYGFLDFSVPGKGFFILKAGQFCTRLGITETLQAGDNHFCLPMTETLQDFSCGVTGCFAIIDGALHYRESIDTANPVGLAWVPVDGPKHEIFKKVVAGPVYELWTISLDGYPYRRLGMTDGIPMGTDWELVPDILLEDVSFGIYGPVGINKHTNEVIILNGSPTTKRQRELDDWCTTNVPACLYPGSSNCPSAGPLCNARFTPKVNNNIYQWRCMMDISLGIDGQVWKNEGVCFYTRHDDLQLRAMRSPVLGDFEKQMWLDQTCEDPEVNINGTACSDPYFADYDTESLELVCHTTVPTVTCPTAIGLHEKLFHLTRGSCADMPLLRYLASSSFYSPNSVTSYDVKLNRVGKAFCSKTRLANGVDVYVDIDFLFLHKICAIATMGKDPNFVDSYRVSYSLDKVNWKKSSVFGESYEFSGNVDATNLVKRYLPAPVEARYLRLTFTAIKASHKCLQLEVYGSSKETEANSCEYYRDRLFATLDGFYNIYPQDTEKKERVFCKGITYRWQPAKPFPHEEIVDPELIGCFHDNVTRAMPEEYTVSNENCVAECQAKAMEAGYEVFGIQITTQCFTGPQAQYTYNKYGEASHCVDGKGGGYANSVYRIRKADKLFWALNTSRDGSPAPMIHGRHAAQVSQSLNTRPLAHFPNHCFSYPTLCNKGQSLEFWLWFTYSTDYVFTTVMQSGIKNDKSQGFRIHLKYHHVCMEVHFLTKLMRSCVGPLGKPAYWVHVLAFWDSETGLTLIVDDLAFRSHSKQENRGHQGFDDSYSVLSLGSQWKSQNRAYEIAIHSLTIWNRKLKEDEVESIFTKGYTLARESETCKATCEAKQLTCCPDMSANLKNVLKRLGVSCSSFAPYDAEEPNQPYVASDGVCHGVDSLSKTSCDVSKVGVRRLCRCERPVQGVFSEWSQWSFCSRTCGSGRRVRTRSCTYPAPRLGGWDCEGITSIHEDCTELPCDVTFGILHDIWLGNPDHNMAKAGNIGVFRTYPHYPTFTHVIENFTMVNTNFSHYGERYRTFFVPPQNGSYKFSMECPHACLMDFKTKYFVAKRLIDVQGGPVTVSTAVQDNLVAGKQYYIMIISVYRDDSRQFSLGFEHKDSGLTQHPITKEYLTWEEPDLHSVLREIWDSRLLAIEYMSAIETFLQTSPEPSFTEMLSSFEAGQSGRYYVQRLSTYFLATENGDYAFYMSCMPKCYMLIESSYVFDAYKVDLSSKWTGGASYVKVLDGGKFYHLVVLYWQSDYSKDYVALGVTLPDGTKLYPLSDYYLWHEVPEKLEIERTITQKSPQSAAGFATDGLPATCSLTSATTDPWLSVETEFGVIVHSVAITNQVPAPSQLDNVYVKVGNHNPASNPKNIKKNAICYGPIPHITSGETISFPCNSPKSGRFIMVHVAGPGRILSICELVVYGQRTAVRKSNSVEGLNDGRVEDYQMTSSPTMPRYEAFDGRLYHPFSSWCAKEEPSMMWEVQFIDKKIIIGFVTQSHPMEMKYVSQARLEALDGENNWIEMRDIANKNVFNCGSATKVNKLKKAAFTKSMRFTPTKWVHTPCTRLEFIPQQSATNYAWELSKMENNVRVKLSGAENPVKLNGKPGLFIPKTSPLELSGFNSPCFWNPKSCRGGFTFGFMITFSDVNSDGVIFSTTGRNTSVVGTSLYLEASKLVVSIRTVSRIWKVSAPANSDASSFELVEITWDYHKDIKLNVGGVTYSEGYTVVAPMPKPSDEWNGVMNFGGVDLSLSWVNFDVEPYEFWTKTRVYYAVDGFHAAEWAPWGYCSQSCGDSGVQYRTRRCSNPAPKFDGRECSEDTVTDTRPCMKPSCDNDDGVLREVWMNKPPPTFSLANVFLSYASHLEVVATFSLTYNDGPFAERLRAFLQPNETGEFKFEMSCAYQCELWISPTDEAEEKAKLSSHNASGDADRTVRTLTAKYNFETGENYYIEVRSLEIKGARNHTLLAIKAPSASVPGTGFSLVRHKPDCYHGLGVESGAIPDGRIFSDTFGKDHQLAYHGRLNGLFPHMTRKWNDYYYYVDLLDLHWIVAVAVQGYDKDGIRGRIASVNIKTRLSLSESGIQDLDNVATTYSGHDNPWEIKMINLTQPTRSRYVQFWIKKYYGDGCFRVDVYGCHAGNLAYKKNTLHPKAVDGGYSRLGYPNCGQILPVDNRLWWIVDLGRPYYIGEVFIVSRRECCLERMHDFEVRIGNSDVDGGNSNPQCGGLYSMWLPQVLPSLSVQCEPYGHGRYLTIATHNNVFDMMICEVAAFQIENDTIFSNWSECSVTCGYGFQQRHTICIKPYYCKSVEEVKPCVAEIDCEILMQNCGQLHALGETKTGTYKVRPDPAIENDIYIYCDHDTDSGGWLVLQRRNAAGSLDMAQPWDMYRDGFGNVSTEFWIGNKYFSQLTNHTAYEIMLVFKLTNGTILKKTKCDAFNVSSEEENYRLQLGSCKGPDTDILALSNWTEFSTKDRDNGVGSFNCAGEITGWWFGSCNSYINGKTMSCFGLASCDYDVTMMIKPNKIDGGWTHWTRWETCDKPCGGGNSSRVRSCTYPPPTGGGDDCDGPLNQTRGCYTNPCPVIGLNITMTFTEEIWNGNLLSAASSLFDEMLNKITRNIKALYDNDPLISVIVNSFRQGSVIADVTILYEALDGQQLIVLQEDLDQDGLLNQNMPVVYSKSEIVVSEVLFGPPEITELVNTTSTSIFIKWQPPNSTVVYKIKGYRIFYKKANDSSLTMLVQSVQAKVLEIEITDLEIFTNYSVRVCAFSAAGNGVPTTAHVVITDEDVPIAAPVVTSAHNLSSTSLNIAWLPVDVPLFHGVPTGYILFYRIQTSDNTTAFLNTTIDDHLVTSTNISDLMKYTVYEIYMTATTIKGEGIRGDSVNYMSDEDVPSHAPGNVTLEKNTSTSLLISWSAIPQKYIHGVLRGHIIAYWPVDDVNDTANATVGPGETEIQLTNLIKFTNYTIKFAGLTYKGIGNWSEVMLQTAEDIPDRGPDNLSGFNLSTTAINVSWGLIPEDFRYGIIIGYRVYYDDRRHIPHSGSLIVPASQRTVVLRDLRSYTVYNISIAGLTGAGEGWNRTFVLIRTSPGAPTRAPWELMCSGISSYTISLYWYRFISDLTGSLLTGYFLSYKAIDPPRPVIHNVTLEAFKYNYVAKGLKGYTNYSFELYVFNPWGRSNTTTIYCFTEEGKPLASPGNLLATSKVSPHKVYLTWDAVPFIEMAGIAQGYTITYRKTKETGEFVEGEEDKRINIFDPQQTEIVIEGLDSYCTYSFAIRVFNGKLSGDDSDKVYADTCNCLEDFYTNWCNYMPYVNTSNTGIFPPLIRSAIYGVCGNCSEYGRPKIHFVTDIQGSPAKKNDLVQVKQSITEQSQINFPVIGRKDSKIFVPIVDSPGSVFVTKKPSLTMVVEYGFLGTIIGTLPLLGFAVLTASLAGLIMWVLESKKNPEHFPTRFISGASEGFWWSFISMTTVGYGDRAPVTVPGRIFAIIWTLYGLVITGLVVGNLTSALTASVAFSVNEVNLYRAKIATVDNSSEFKLGLSKGAFVNKDRSYSGVSTVLHAVEVGSVEGALLDIYMVASRPELQRKDSPLMVKTIIENPSAYGIELAGHAKKLREPFLHYLHNQAALVTSKLEEYTRPVKETEHDVDAEALEGDEINVLAPDSPIIKPPLLYSSIALIVAVVLGLVSHFALCRRRKTFHRNGAAVSPVSDSTELRSAMDEHVKEFCENSKTTLADIKHRHQTELKAFTKK